MFTRKQYLNNEVSHHDYFIQFATEEMREEVMREIGTDRIKQSKDEHLNDIPLHVWDGLPVPKKCLELLEQANEGYSKCAMVCIYKAIAMELAKIK